MDETPQIRILDKSRDFGTLHGDRGQGDPDHGVHFMQDGLPLDAQGFLVAHHATLQGESKEATKLRELAERKLKRAIKVQQRIEDEGSGAEDDEGGDGDAPINLEAWARGTERVEWNDVTQTIAQRYKKRVGSKVDALEFLIEEKVVAFDQLSPAHQKILRS